MRTLRGQRAVQTSAAWEEQTKAEPRTTRKRYLRYSFVGIEMGIAIAIGLGGGWYLDKHLGTRPVFFFIGLVLGLGAAAKAIWQAARQAQRELEDDRSENDAEQG